MPTASTPLVLPLLLAGVSPPLEESLRRAGVPVVIAPVHAGANASPAATGCRFVLLDSRTEAGRRASRTRSAQQTGIDVARLPAAPDTAHNGNGNGRDGSAEREFLRALKTRLERCGGTWARLAELPYPYRSLRCGSRKAGADESGGLTWTATGKECAAWCEARARLTLSVADDGDGLEIQCGGAAGRWQPALELWRGRHVAVLPISAPRMTIHESGPVFLRAADASRAGLPDESILELCRALTAGAGDRRAA